MPRCVFKLLWDRISVDKKEIFAYVINRCANGDHYWVFAHVTPTFDDSGQVLGFHSNRRVPSRDVLNNTIIPLYKTLLERKEILIEEFPSSEDFIDTKEKIEQI